ncbi:MAG: RNA polymerase sigma-70 factor [Tannerellaceae bacterium]|jgi:RNA polymerase sigma-70 factor (ECF subfamily)|nr:RNA polymerase sigma-70 factor [Tannerellaceae bacterium]
MQHNTIEKHTDDVSRWMNEIANFNSRVAFESLYYHYFDRLLRFVSLYVPILVEAEEIVLDTFTDIWSGRKKLLPVKNPDAYIYSITRNKAISFLRSQHKNMVPLNETMIDLFIHVDTTPESDLISKENIRQLNGAINSLPYKCKMAFKMVREDKMKYKDVAIVLNISVKTVEAHIATATKKLREILSSGQK